MGVEPTVVDDDDDDVDAGARTQNRILRTFHRVSCRQRLTT